MENRLNKEPDKGMSFYMGKPDEESLARIAARRAVRRLNAEAATPEFARLLLATWIGEAPTSEGVKRGLLAGQAPG